MTCYKPTNSSYVNDDIKEFNANHTIGFILILFFSKIKTKTRTLQSKLETSFNFSFFFLSKFKVGT
jgi:hypothetical protein